MYYSAVSYLIDPLGNNTIDFEQRKKIGSDCILYIPPLIQGTIDDVKTVSGYVLGVSGKVAYEYISDSGKLISASGLECLVEIERFLPEYTLSLAEQEGQIKKNNSKHIYIIDNHNHAFYCRWKSYLEGKTSRGSHLIHIDQHSDLNEVSLRTLKEVLLGEGTKQSRINKNSTLQQVAQYTNEVLNIASFIKPAKEIGLISDYEMILTEYSLSQLSTFNFGLSTILDIDLDFRAPEMSIENYDQTINQVRKLISLPQVQCITIATSPTYIDQKLAIKILYDILG